MEASLCRHHGSLIQSPASLLFPEGGGRVKVSKFLIMALSFWLPLGVGTLPSLPHTVRESTVNNYIAATGTNEDCPSKPEYMFTYWETDLGASGF